jgi:deferrochelatase/peroxidase EfeB
VSDRPESGVTRRRLLGTAGLAGAGIGLGAGGFLLGRETGEAEAAETVPFYGEHQAGIDTAAQDRLHFAAFDLTIETARELRDLLRAWSAAAAEMTAGRMVGQVNDDPLAPTDDTGEALGSSAGRLTVTIGLGPDVFERAGEDRLGLGSRRPSGLRQIPPLPADELDAAISGGDLCVQACSDDPQVAFHAVRDLARIGRGAVVMRWSQLGFGRTSTTTRAQATPRNLMGFKDGTNNIRAEDKGDMRRFVWLGARDRPGWMRGGTYMVTRRIRMLLEVWDRSSLRDQEQTIGRRKYSGAPLGEQDEFDRVELGEEDAAGRPAIPMDAHIRLAAPAENADLRILRRGYSFTDGVVEELGELDAGLFFICFQRDPLRQFAAIQRQLGSSDALNEYIRHTSSAVFAIPPGANPGGFVGEGLFA